MSEVIEDAAAVFVDLKRNTDPSDHEIHETIHSMQWATYLAHGMTFNRDYNKERIARAVRTRIKKLVDSKKYHNENYKLTAG